MLGSVCKQLLVLRIVVRAEVDLYHDLNAEDMVLSRTVSVYEPGLLPV